MLYTFSIPIIDKRIFLSCDTYRLDMKQFPRYWNDGSFLRSFGQFGYRNSPGKDIPFQEKVYAQANRGLLIADNQQIISYNKSNLRLSCVFRRVFFDEYSARVDTGIKDVRKSPENMQFKEFFDSINAILDCKVYAKHCSGKAKKLIDIGKDLSREYLYATTMNPGENWSQVDANWLSSGCPSMVIECASKEIDIASLKRSSYIMEVPGLPTEWDVELYYMSARHALPVWIIVKGMNPKKDKLRALRILLLKYHQERETLKYVMKLVAEKGNNENLIQNEVLKEYLDTITSVFSRKKRDGIEQKYIIDIVRSVDEYVYVNEYQELLKYLSRHMELQFLERRCKVVAENHYYFQHAKINNLITEPEFHDKVYFGNAEEGILKLNELLDRLDESVQKDNSADTEEAKKCIKGIKEELKKSTPNKNKLEQYITVLKAITISGEFVKLVASIAEFLGFAQ